MIKPKRKRPTDTVQLAHSVFADVIKLAENLFSFGCGDHWGCNFI
jgi:hypothetical protein